MMESGMKMTQWLAAGAMLSGGFMVAQEAADSETVAAPKQEWLHSRGDISMTGRSPVSIQSPLKLAWQMSLMEKPKGSNEMLVSGAIVRDDRIYVGTKDGFFHCLELETGKEIWKAEALGAFDGAAAYVEDMVVAGCQDGFVYAWKAVDGKEVWKFESDAEIHAAANVWQNPDTGAWKVLIGSYDYQVYCLDAKTGKKDWAAETGYYINGGAAISEGKVVFGGCDSVLHVHDLKNGEEVRQIDVGSYIGNNVSIADGVIYVSHYGNLVQAFSMEDGMEIWQFGERAFEYFAAPAIASKVILVGGRDKRFHCLDRVTGEQAWEFRARDRIDSSAVVCNDETVIFGSDDGYLYQLAVADGKELWSYEIGAPVKAPPAVAGKWVIVGADDGSLYAFRPAGEE